MQITPALVVLLMLGQVESPQHKANWPLAIGESKFASSSPFVRRLSEALNGREGRKLALGTIPSVVSGAIAAGGSHPPDFGALSPTERAKFEKPILDREAAVRLASQGYSTLARQKLEAGLMSNPGEYYALPLIDVELAQGDYVSAYKVAIPFVKSGRASRSLLIRASLAASSLGEVYEGQRDYLMKIVAFTPDTPTWAAMPKGDSPEVVAALSSCAIADEFGETGDYASALPYCAAALRSDPGNPSFSIGVAVCSAHLFRYSDAIKVCESGLKRAGTGYFRDVLKPLLSACRKDLRTVGDGHPEPGAAPQVQMVSPGGTIHP